MQPFTRAEDTPGTVDFRPRWTRYLSEAEQERRRVRVDRVTGLLHDADGALLDTGGPVAFAVPALGTDPDGKPVHLSDLWPTPVEVNEVVESALASDMFVTAYGEVFDGDERWQALRFVYRVKDR